MLWTALQFSGSNRLSLIYSSANFLDHKTLLWRHSGPKEISPKVDLRNRRVNKKRPNCKILGEYQLKYFLVFCYSKFISNTCLALGAQYGSVGALRPGRRKEGPVCPSILSENSPDIQQEPTYIKRAHGVSRQNLDDYWQTCEWKNCCDLKFEKMFNKCIRQPPFILGF